MEWAVEKFKEIGFSLDLCESRNGMITIVAQKPEIKKMQVSFKAC